MKNIKLDKFTSLVVYKNPNTLINYKPKLLEVIKYKEILHPNWVTGFTDAEGSFLIDIRKRSKLRIGYGVEPCFQIIANIRDKELIENIKEFFQGVGNIKIDNKNRVYYIVKKLDDIINIIIPHFNQFPLLTNKKADFILFCQVIKILQIGGHKTKSGLDKILSIRSAMNRGLNPQLKKTFPNTRIVERPTILVPNIINGDWLAGFVNGDGSFSVIIREETADRGLEIRLNLNITQHIRDFDLLKSFINLLKCGNVYKYKDSCIFQVVSFTAINTIIIPGYFLISTYQLHGKKA